jgi:hypothetical protein
LITRSALFDVIRALDHLRRLPPGRIRRAKAHLLHHHAVDRVAGEALGRGEPDELDALFLGIGDLALRARHVGPVAAIEAFDACRPLPDGGAHAVHRRVAAADDDDALAVGVQLTEVNSGTSSPKPTRFDAVR